MYARLAPSENTAEFKRLYRDHAAIREKLQQATSTLNDGSPDSSPNGGARIPQSTKLLCAALARQLRAHMRHEGRLVTRCSMVLGRVGPNELARFALEHDADQESLRIINQLLSNESNGWVAHMGPLLLKLMIRLKRQMDDQEADLFPFMERVLAVNERVLAVNGHGNGAAQIEGSNGTEPEGAWKPSVARQKSSMSVVHAL